MGRYVYAAGMFTSAGVAPPTSRVGRTKLVGVGPRRHRRQRAVKNMATDGDQSLRGARSQRQRHGGQ